MRASKASESARSRSTSAETALSQDIVACTRCPRLRKHCEAVARGETLPRKAYLEEVKNNLYWRKPVPDFGSTPSDLLIVGLAPAAHGANRTGRMFTGDDSGKWLYRALHKANFAKTACYETKNDNELVNACITAVAHCAPPDNKPSTSEIANCRPFLVRRFEIANPKIVLALGGIAWNAALDILTGELGFECPRPKLKFSHLAKVELVQSSRRIFLVGSYHPSRQNTNTKRLTEPMFDSVFELVNQLKSSEFT
jgi:uracil-DNA glycosylase